MRTSIFLAVFAAMALSAAALPAPKPCKTQVVENRYGVGDVNVLSGNGENSGLLSSGNDNGFHQGPNGSYDQDNSDGKSNSAENEHTHHNNDDGDNDKSSANSTANANAHVHVNNVDKPSTTTKIWHKTVTNTAYAVKTASGWK